MGALQVLAIAVSALLVLENGLREAEGASYAFTTRLQPSSSNRAPAKAAATQPNAVVASGTRNRADLSFTDYRRYLPVEHTPEVKEAREQFFRLYKKQASLAGEAPDNDLDGTMSGARATNQDDDYYYYDDYEGENSEYEEDDDDDEESEGSEEEDEYDEEEDSDEESEDSDEDDSDEDSSSSSEEDGLDSSEENGLDSSEEGADSSSEEGLDGEDSSSSSSSEEDDENGGAAARTPWGSRGGYLPLNTNTLTALRPVTDTPEVKKAKRTFFDLYKAQAELSFNAPDDK